jgi:hypothetical protein
MISFGRHLKLLGIVFLTLPALASTGPGYLATVGPAPLRFWSPSKPKPAPAASPAVSNEAATPNSYDFLAAFGAPTPASAPAPDATNAPPAASTDMNAASQAPQFNAPQQGAPQFNAPQPGDVVSPQMLLQYFNKNTTNGVGAGIIAPMNMSVPNNPTPPPSSATYSN